jgi:hypothetical protein
MPSYNAYNTTVLLNVGVLVAKIDFYISNFGFMVSVASLNMLLT